jgi:putative DNA primase/helicase
MLTNFLPVVRGDDPAVWRRILAVPFDVVVPPEERDVKLPEKLRACPEAILAWLWRGWLDYCKQGLAPPETVLAATRKYEHDSDVLARFLDDESVVVRGHGSVASGALYKRFQEWARAEGEPTEMTNKAFTEALEKRGFTRKKTRAGAVWQQIMIAESDDG